MAVFLRLTLFRSGKIRTAQQTSNDVSAVKRPSRHCNFWSSLVVVNTQNTLNTRKNNLLFFSRGCFLTSSLIATVAMSLTIPMSMVADVLLKKVSYPCLFYAGTIPVVVAFIAVTVLSHYENWDPVLDGFRWCYVTACRRTRSFR